MFNDFQAERGRGGGGGAAADAGLRPLRQGIKKRRSLLRAFAAEPLTHFVLIGALLFIVSHALQDRSSRYRIDITPAEVDRIATSYAQQYGAVPSGDQLRTMVGNRVKEEIFFREGVALGLDKDDEIVRRRIAQKFEFLQNDTAAPSAPSAADLRAYYDSHAAAYREPSRRTIDQIYFAMDERGEAAARALAASTLDSLSANKAASAPGDDFPGPKVLQALSQDDVSRVFGGDAFAAQIFSAPVGRWVGPFRSGYGWHLIRVAQVLAPRQLPFDQVRARVASDWADNQRAAANDANYSKLLSHYTITLPGSGK